MHKFKIDFHSHEPEFIHLSFLKGNDKENSKKFVEKAFKIPGNLAVGITNFDNNEIYEKFLASLKLLPYKVDYSNKDCFISITKNNRTIYIIKTDEIDTDKGHILLIGHKGKIGKTNLKVLLKKAHKEKDIIIATHPLHEFGVSHFIIKRFFTEKPINITEKELKKDKKGFDAIELNSYFPEDWNKIKEFAKKENMKIVAESDAHFLNEFFNSYFELEGLDFTNAYTFKKSLKQALKHHIRLHPHSNGFTAKYKHAIQNLLDIVGLKLKILKE